MRIGAQLVRSSGTKQADKGETWERQEERGKQWAAANNANIAKIFFEPYTGRERIRPILNEVFKFLTQNPEITFLLVTEIDRFTRGGSEYYHSFKRELISRGVELVDIMGVILPTKNTLEDTGFEYSWSRISPSRMGETMMAEYAHNEVTSFLTRAIGQEIRLNKNGYVVRPAPLGFQNQKIEDSEGKTKTIHIPHPQEAIWMETMFRLRAEGVLTDEEICERVNALGFRTRIQKRRERFTRKLIGTAGGLQLTPKMMQKYLRQPKYCGVVIEKWTDWKPVRAPYAGLITIDTFNRANRGKIRIIEFPKGELEVEYETPIPRSKENPEFPYRKVVLCPKCEKSFSGSFSRGKLGKRYPYYHCERDHKGVNIVRQTFHDTIEAVIQKLEIAPETRELFEVAVLEVWKQTQTDKKQWYTEVEKNSAHLKMEQEKLLDQLTQAESSVVRKLLEEKIEALEIEKTKSKTTASKNRISKSDLTAFLATMRRLMENPAELLLEPQNPQSLSQMWALAFESPPTYENMSFGTPKLSVAMRLCVGKRRSKEQLVAQLSQNWNTFARQVRNYFPG